MTPMRPIRILLVEDDDGDARLVRELLTDAAGSRFELDRVSSLAEAVGRCAGGQPDVVLLDLQLPDARGLAAFEHLQRHAEDVPLIVLTGLTDEAAAEYAVAHGAQDYLLKGELDPRTLWRAIRYALDRYRIIREMRGLLAEANNAKATLEHATEVKDEFIAVSSHELRTPVTLIRGFSEVLRSHWDELSEKDRRRQVHIIAEHAGRLSDLLEDLLVFSWIGREAAAPLERTPLGEALLEAVNASLLALEVTTLSCPDGLEVLCTPQHLQRMLVNYFDNAAKYGRPPVSVVATREGEEVEIRVRDAGDGVPEEFIPHLFEKFTQAEPSSTRRARGTGLGLAIVATLAALDGGAAWYEPGAPDGPCFVLRLPVAGSPEPLPDRPLEQPGATPRP
jgi:signal transduction histidine kinase